MRLTTVLGACLALVAISAAPAPVRADVDREADGGDREEAPPRPELEREGEVGDPEAFQRQVLDEGRKNLEEIQRLLDEVERDLASKNTGSGTQSKQREATKKMTSLIEKLAEACQQCQGGGGSGSKSKPGQSQASGQQSQGGKQQPSGETRENQDQLSSEKQREQGQRQDSKPGEQDQDAPGQVPNNEVAEGELPDSGEAEVLERLRNFRRWGLLPPKARDETLSASAKEPPREYREIIEQYYRRISDYYGERRD